jgi:uncharacterized protein
MTAASTAPDDRTPQPTSDTRAMILRLALAASILAAPSAVAQTAFVHVYKGDTTVVERFTRTATRLDVDLAPKSGPRMQGSSTLTADGRIQEIVLRLFAPGASVDAPPTATGVLRLIGDTAIAELTPPGGKAQVQRIPSKANAQPMFNNSFAMLELLVQTARRARTSDATATVLLATGGLTTNITFSGLLTDSVVARIATTTLWLVTNASGDLIRAGIPSQSLTVTRISGADVSKLPLQAKPDYSAPSGAPYTAEDVTVPTPFGHTLGGTLTKPSGTTLRLPVVISSTGSGPQDRDEYIDIIPQGYRLFRQVADTLARRGVAMLRMDDRGYGASGGAFGSATSRDFANDIRAAIAYLRSRSDIDASRIFVVGHSEGGMVAPMVALDEPQLAGIVLLAGPGRTGRQILEFQGSGAIRSDTSLTEAARTEALGRVPARVDSLVRSTPWLTFFATHDPLAVARRVRTPVLILQGADDQQVIAAEAPMLERAFRAGGNRDVTMRVFPELNHFFIRQPGGSPAGYSTLSTNLASSEVLGTAVEWIVRRAKATRRGQ